MTFQYLYLMFNKYDRVGGTNINKVNQSIHLYVNTKERSRSFDALGGQGYRSWKVEAKQSTWQSDSL